MKIKTIKYERLFNVGDYQNETIGFTADLDEKEKPETALAKLFEMVTTANKKINEIRVVVSKLFALQRDDGGYCSSIYYSERCITNLKNKIKQLRKKSVKTKDKQTKDDTKFLCEKYKSEILEEETNLKKKKAEEKILTKQYQQMINDFKKGILKET